MFKEIPFYIQATIKMVLLALIVLTLIIAREFLIPFTISVFLAFLLYPVSSKLRQWKFPHVLAIILSILLALLVIGSIVFFFISQVQSFGDDLPNLQKQLETKWAAIQNYISEKFHVTERQQSQWLYSKLKETAQSGDTMVMNIFSATGSFFANVALMPIYIFFLTYYKDKFKKFIVLVSKNENHEHVLEIIKRISTVSQKYLKGIGLDILILSVLNSIGFLLLDLDHAILFAVLASLLNIIPYVGVLIGSILPIAMALLTKDEIGYAIGVAAVTQVVQFLDNNFITPYVVGSSVSINPFAAIIALVVWALIWGLPGMILCLPIMGVLKVLCDNVESLKPYGYIIGEENDLKAKRRIFKRSKAAK